MYSYTNNIKKNDWEIFMNSHPKTTIFQSPEIYEAYLKLDNIKSHLYAQIKNNKLTGILLGYTISEFHGLASYFTTRFLVIGGPLVNEDGDYEDFCKYILKNIPSKVVYTRFINIFSNEENFEILKKYKFEFEPHLNFHFNLTIGTDQLWDNINSTRKKQIKRAIKRGLVVTNPTEIDIQIYYNILKETYTRAKQPLVGLDYFKVMYNGLKNNIVIFSGFYEQNLIAFRIVIKYKSTLYDWYAGNLTSSSSFYPNDLLTWEVIKYGSENNYKLFDFGGAGHPDKPYGVRDFKKTYGGNLVNNGNHLLINKRFFYNILNWLKFIKEIISK
jgi:serine/alanine adding enzyme